MTFSELNAVKNYTLHKLLHIAIRNIDFMGTQKQNMKPQDVVVLLKIISLKEKSWSQITLEGELFMSQSEISQSIARSKYARLLFPDGKKVMKLPFF